MKTTPEEQAKFDAERKAYHKAQAVEQIQRLARMAGDLQKTLERHADEMKYPPKTDSRLTISNTDRFTWAINEVENFMRNLNFATLARHASALDR